MSLCQHSLSFIIPCLLSFTLHDWRRDCIRRDMNHVVFLMNSFTAPMMIYIPHSVKLKVWIMNRHVSKWERRAFAHTKKKLLNANSSYERGSDVNEEQKNEETMFWREEKSRDIVDSKFNHLILIRAIQGAPFERVFVLRCRKGAVRLLCIRNPHKMKQRLPKAGERYSVRLLFHIFERVTSTESEFELEADW